MTLIWTARRLWWQADRLRLIDRGVTAPRFLSYEWRIMKIAFITDDWVFDDKADEWVPSSSVFYRCDIPRRLIANSVLGRPRFNQWEGFGIEVPDHDEGRFGFDIVVLKHMTGKNVRRQIEIARSLGQRVIVDIDDLMVELEEDNAAFAQIKASESSGYNWQHHEANALAADTITVSTIALFERYSKVHPDVRLVRNRVLPKWFDLHKQLFTPVIGWVGMMSYRSHDLEPLKDWLPEFIEQNNLMFHHSGHHETLPAASRVIGIPDRFSQIHPSVPISRLRKLYCFDIGLVPMQDIPFNHAKSFLKGLEYAISGIPFIASDLPEYRILRDLGIGRIASTGAQWAAHAKDLLDWDTRNAEAMRQRALVLKHLDGSSEDAYVEWERAINE